MFSHRRWGTLYRTVFLSSILCVPPSPTTAQLQAGIRKASTSFRFVRVFSSADDVKPEHPVLGRTLDIIAGPADPEPRANTIHSASDVTTDSKHRVFVADPGAQTVHVFDFIRSKYGRLEGRGGRLQDPVSLAADGQDNLYVVDQGSRTILVYDSAGKFRRSFGKLRGGESYFESPTGIAIDKSAGRIYVCDTQGHTIFVMDERGKLIRKLGNRGGGGFCERVFAMAIPRRESRQRRLETAPPATAVC